MVPHHNDRGYFDRHDQQHINPVGQNVLNQRERPKLDLEDVHEHNRDLCQALQLEIQLGAKDKVLIVNKNNKTKARGTGEK